MEDEALYIENMKRVEKADGAPLVYFPYGFRFIEVDGRTYMTPLERSEFEEITSDLAGPRCGTLSFGECYRGSGCGTLVGGCIGRYAYGGYICQCATGAGATG